AECFPLNDDYILITINYKPCEIYLFDIKNRIYQLLNTIKDDNNWWYRTINITKYYNNNNNYHFIILSYNKKDENLLSYSFELIFESNNKYKFNLKKNYHFNNQKIELEGCRSLLSGNNNHIVFLTHHTDDKNYLTMYNLKNNIINTIQISKDNISFSFWYYGFFCININVFIIFLDDIMYKI